MYNYILGGQLCTDSVDIQQNSDDEIEYNGITIIPRLNFTCNGRITIIRARVRRYKFRIIPSFFQIWRPSSTNSTVYDKIGEVQLLSDDQVTGSGDYRTANITLTGDNTIEVQSGDVVGYYQLLARYQLRTIQTDGYILHEFNNEFPPQTSVDLNSASHHIDKRQPLTEFIIGKCVLVIDV